MGALYHVDGLIFRYPVVYNTSHLRQVDPSGSIALLLRDFSSALDDTRCQPFQRSHGLVEVISGEMTS